MRGVRHWGVAMLAVFAIAGIDPAAVPATPLARLRASFSPNRLGAPTTIRFGLSVSDSIAQEIPPPLTEMDLSLPAGMGLASSTLGLAECDPNRLLVSGPSACPANSHVGYGAALGLLEAEGERVHESATVTAVLGPPVGEDEQVLFYVEANAPVSAELVFSGRILPNEVAGFGGRILTGIPLVSAWAGGPVISLTQFSSTLGPTGLTYYRRVDNELVPYKPRGVAVPARCPRGGFPFFARLAFADGSRAIAKTSVSCPRD